MAKNVIVESVSKTDQDVCLHIIEVIEGKKIKFDIRSNSIKLQCHARVHVWNDVAQNWNLIHYIFPQVMQTSKSLCYGPDVCTVEDFATDLAELRRVALAVLS